MSGPIRVAVLTVSDRCSRGQTVDTSGPALAEMAAARLSAELAARECVPDETDRIAAVFTRWSRPQERIDLLLSTGGTGLAPRDVTPEAAKSVFEREHAGLMDLARLRCLSKTPRTFLSRGVAGTIGRTLILTLPGSQRGCTEMFEALLDILPHAIETLRGEVVDDGRPASASTPADPPTGKVVRHEF